MYSDAEEAAVAKRARLGVVEPGIAAPPVLQPLLQRLPLELLYRIAGCLPPNDVACSLRLVSTVFAAHFRSPAHTTVRLSQPSPHHAFAHRWGSWSATRGLPLAKRRKLVCLTAATGTIPNLRVVAGGPGVTQAVGTAGCVLSAAVFAAAAGAGQQAVCEELYQLGCPWAASVVDAAARGGHLGTVRALIDKGCPWSLGSALAAAAYGSHEHVVLALQELAAIEVEDPRSRQPNMQHRSWLLVGAAYSLELPALLRLHAQYWDPNPGGRTLCSSFARDMLASAAASATPDFHQKVEWVEDLLVQLRREEAAVAAGGGGVPVGGGGGNGVAASAAAEAAAARVDLGLYWSEPSCCCLNEQPITPPCLGLVERLKWLAGRGYTMGKRMAVAMAALGDVPAMEFLLSSGHLAPNDTGGKVAQTAAANGHLPILQLLHSRGCALYKKPSGKAIQRMLQLGFSLEPEDEEAPWWMSQAASAATRKGHLHVVVWLVETLGRSQLSEGMYKAAAAAAASRSAGGSGSGGGSGSSAGGNGSGSSSSSGSRQMLEWLHSQGCPGALDAEDFISVVECGDVQLLQWMRERGCSWSTNVVASAVMHGCIEVLEWLVEAGCPSQPNLHDKCHQGPSIGRRFHPNIDFYRMSAGNGDLGMLVTLRQIGHAPRELTLDLLDHADKSLPMLQFIIKSCQEAGYCPWSNIHRCFVQQPGGVLPNRDNDPGVDIWPALKKESMPVLRAWVKHLESVAHHLTELRNTETQFDSLEEQWWGVEGLEEPLALLHESSRSLRGAVGKLEAILKELYDLPAWEGQAWVPRVKVGEE